MCLPVSCVRCLQLSVILDTCGLPDNLRSFLALFSEALVDSPLLRDGGCRYCALLVAVREEFLLVTVTRVLLLCCCCLGIVLLSSIGILTVSVGLDLLPELSEVSVYGDMLCQYAVTCSVSIL